MWQNWLGAGLENQQMKEEMAGEQEEARESIMSPHPEALPKQIPHAGNFFWPLLLPCSSATGF